MWKTSTAYRLRQSWRFPLRFRRYLFNRQIRLKWVCINEVLRYLSSVPVMKHSKCDCQYRYISLYICMYIYIYSLAVAGYVSLGSWTLLRKDAIFSSFVLSASLPQNWLDNGAVLSHSRLWFLAEYFTRGSVTAFSLLRNKFFCAFEQSGADVNRNFGYWCL